MNDKVLKVTDKRMFTPEGELREEFQDFAALSEADEAGDAIAEADFASEPVPAARPIETAETPDAPHPTASAHEAGGVQVPLEIPDLGPSGAYGPPGFLDLVSLLAEPIALSLGDLELPDGASAENLDMARVYIDLLAVLRQKTAGNLTAQEASVLEDLLYRSRMRYVQKRG